MILKLSANRSLLIVRIMIIFQTVFQMHFHTSQILRAEVSAHSRRAQDTEYNNQNLLDELQEDISKIEDADLAFLLTRIEMLMLQKDAAQATFTRIASKSLFDFLG